jgi:hypothetical protein
MHGYFSTQIIVKLNQKQTFIAVPDLIIVFSNKTIKHYEN